MPALGRCALGFLLLAVTFAGARAAEATAAPLVVVIDAEPAHLNPLLDPDLWGYRIAHDLLCEPLLRRRPQPLGTALGPAAAEPTTADFEPVLADHYRLDADGRGIELTLRSGVRFHDGRPLSIHDVRATLDLVRSAGPSAPRTQALLGDVVRLQVIGKDQLRIDLRPARPAPGQRPEKPPAILTALSEIDILPASAFANGRLGHQPFNRRPICTGPYRLADWRRGGPIVLRRFAGYWGPRPQSDELRFRVASDGGQGLSLLRQGEADVLGRVMPRYLADQVDPAVLRGRFRKVELDADQVVVVIPNSQKPLLGQPLVRRALSLLWDRERLLRDVRRGQGTPLHQPSLGPQVATRDGLGDGLAAAEALLDQAELRRGSADGLRLSALGGPGTVKTAVRLRLLLPAGSAELGEVARRLADGLAKAGLKLDSEAVDLPTFAARLRRGEFELALCAWSWSGGSFDVEPLLAYSGLAPTGELVAHFADQAPLFLLYRPRQVVLYSPQIEVQSRSGDFLNLRSIGRAAQLGRHSVLRAD